MKKLLSVILAIMLIFTLLPGEFLLTASAADLTKLAMIELYNNQELRDLGFKMLVPIHHIF